MACPLSANSLPAKKLQNELLKHNKITEEYIPFTLADFTYPITGRKESIIHASELAKDNQGKVINLNVSIAGHSPLVHCLMRIITYMLNDYVNYIIEFCKLMISLSTNIK